MLTTVRRFGIVATATSAVMFASINAALAGDWYGDIDCGQSSYPGCELGAGQRGHDAPAPRPDPRSGAPKTHDGQRDTTSPPGDRIVGGEDTRADCSYVRSDYQPPSNGIQTASHRSGHSASADVRFASLARSTPHGPRLVQAPGQAGAWYVYRCSGPGSRDALFRAPVWFADGQAPGVAPVPSPQQLAEQARSQLRLPSPVIASSPVGTQLVRLPTWLWLDRAMWQPRSAMASVPAVSVTATAIPTSVSWSTGDGATVTCTGPGTPFPAGGAAQATSPDCGHTYQRSSAGSPGDRFPITATVSWRITWAGGGAAGAFPDLTTSAAAALRVAEAQALGTG
ncbi:hypothetical protein SAMN04489727_1936 [Amycolatopsis tolypomycina]|uniref:ATP/GTP-binding protein n=1 Tax=Amycolatopsis tolypomycina TaxID=208445 RepID=A0A1H4JIL1_9PSEU|nr:hypothetical protein [Amycolatopsis tolypomycina]SEB46131.1 hypothetical protein SAMN04489727_1936 [Amycolatopsis tolypomycina]